MSHSSTPDRSEPFPGAPRPVAFPTIEEALIVALERVFPDRAPESALSNDAIRERIGEVRVLRFLKHQRDRQQRVAAAQRLRRDGASASNMARPSSFP